MGEGRYRDVGSMILKKFKLDSENATTDEEELLLG